MRWLVAVTVASACALFGACAEAPAGATAAPRPGVHEGDLGGCRARGDVDLVHLASLVEVTGSLTLRQCLELERTAGLEQLRQVGALGLIQLPRLRRVDAPSLTTVREALIVSRAASLESLAGLASVTTVGENLVLEDLPHLRGLDGLGAVTEVGHLQIMRNERLEDLSGLASLRVVRGELRITDNPQLPASAIEALLARIETKGVVRIENNGTPARAAISSR